MFYFSNATKRKKKKPTSFIPPPNLNLQATNLPPPLNNINANLAQNASTNSLTPQNTQITIGGGPMEVPFWRQPLPRNSMAGGSSETEGSVASSRINIQLKLQEKKQKQLAELKIIEEEIKQGKLSRKMTHDSCENDVAKVLPRLPAPRSKRHIDIETIDFNRRNSSCSEADNVNILLYQLQQQKNDSSNLLYNNFSSSSGIGIAAALTKFSHEILTNLNIGENSANVNNNNTNSNKQPSASSTMTSTTSENENNSLTRQMVSTRQKLLHHNLVTNNLSASPNRIGSPHYDPRPSAYNSLESKSKTDTNRSNSKNENSNGSNNNVNTNSIEKEKSLASQLIKRQMARGNTPEILLAPSHLDGNSHYFQHYQTHMNSQAPKIPLRGMNGGVLENVNNYIR